MTTTPGSSLLVIERLLRDRDGIWRQIIEERSLKQLIGSMLTSSALSLALYGAVLGASNGGLQALASFVKLPLLFLATLAICLPTLYLFNLVFGARLSMLQAVTLIMVTITVTSVLTLAFAPISLFFLITAQSYSFFKVLNVAILLLTALIGLHFLRAGMAAFNAHQTAVAEAKVHRAATSEAVEAEAKDPALVGSAPERGDKGHGEHPHRTAGAVERRVPPNGRRVPLEVREQLPAGERPASMALLNIWILLFGFVGTQLAWTLRPFFGSPGEPFEVFRSISGTFYEDVFTTVGRLLGQ